MRISNPAYKSRLRISLLGMCRHLSLSGNSGGLFAFVLQRYQVQWLKFGTRHQNHDGGKSKPMQIYVNSLVWICCQCSIAKSRTPHWHPAYLSIGDVIFYIRFSTEFALAMKSLSSAPVKGFCSKSERLCI